jgi:CheY-like chemotaxis protein
MAQVLVIDTDPGTLHTFSTILHIAGHQVITTSSGLQGLDVFRRQSVELIIADLHIQDMSGLDLLKRIRSEYRFVPVVLATEHGTTEDAVLAMRSGANDFIDKPVSEEHLLTTVERALQPRDTDHPRVPMPKDDVADQPSAPSRLARAMVLIVDSVSDPRTIQDWSQNAFVSPGALRNWCRMTAISPRRALVFARLLRAVLLSQGGQHRLENLLDIVDRRTLVGLLTFAGLDPHSDLPNGLDAFLDRQILVQHPDVLMEVRRAADARDANSQHAASLRSMSTKGAARG